MTITRQEFYDAIEAYNVSGEIHKTVNCNEPYLAFDVRVLIKMNKIIKERNLTPLEVFHSCDVSNDEKISI